MTQRNLAERLGLEGNGFITLVAGGKRTVPGDKIPAWADALDLKGKERQQFIDECASECLPAWAWDRLTKAESDLIELRREASDLRSDMAKLTAKVAKVVIKRHNPIKKN